MASPNLLTKDHTFLLELNWLSSLVSGVPFFNNQNIPWLQLQCFGGNLTALVFFFRHCISQQVLTCSRCPLLEAGKILVENLNHVSGFYMAPCSALLFKGRCTCQEYICNSPEPFQDTIGSSWWVVVLLSVVTGAWMPSIEYHLGQGKLFSMDSIWYPPTPKAVLCYVMWWSLFPKNWKRDICVIILVFISFF